MKIGLFGGTFDPPHIGHIELAASLLEQTGLDKIWFLVTPQNPWKQGRALSSDHHRYAMVDISLREKPGLEASDYEFGMPKPTYTYKTLRSLRSSFPDVTFALIIGGDNWASFDKWAEYEEILHNHPVIVYPRPGCPVETPEAVRQIIAENSAYIAESDNISEAAAALTVLGYSSADAKNALARLDSALSVEELVKEALKLMM